MSGKADSGASCISATEAALIIKQGAEQGTEDLVNQVWIMCYDLPQYARPAIQALAKNPTTETLSAIRNIGCYHEKHALFAIKTLEEIGTKDVVSPLGDLGHTHRKHAPRCIEALANIKTNKSVFQIEEIVLGHDAFYTDAIKSFTAIGTDLAAQKIATFAHKYPRCITSAIEGLAEMHEKRGANPPTEAFIKAVTKTRYLVLHAAAGSARAANNDKLTRAFNKLGNVPSIAPKSDGSKVTQSLQASLTQGFTK